MEEKIPRNVRFKDEDESQSVEPPKQTQTDSNKEKSINDPPESLNTPFDLQHFLESGNPICFNGIEIGPTISQEIDIEELK